MRKIIILILATLLSGCAGVPICEKSLEKKNLAADEKRVIEIGSKLLKFYPLKQHPLRKVRVEIKDSSEIDAHVSQKWNNKITLNKGLIDLTNSEHELAMILAHQIVQLQFFTLTDAVISDAAFSALCGFPMPYSTYPMMAQVAPTLGQFSRFTKKEKRLITADIFATMISYQAGYDCLALIGILERIKTQYPNSRYYKNHPLFSGRKKWIKKLVKNIEEGNLVPGLVMCLCRPWEGIDTILQSQEFSKKQLVNTARSMGFSTEIIKNLTGQEIIIVKMPYVRDPGFLICNDKILRQAVPKDYQKGPSSMDMIRGNF